MERDRPLLIVVAYSQGRSWGLGDGECCGRLRRKIQKLHKICVKIKNLNKKYFQRTYFKLFGQIKVKLIKDFNFFKFRNLY